MEQQNYKMKTQQIQTERRNFERKRWFWYARIDVLQMHVRDGCARVVQRARDKNICILVFISWKSINLVGSYEELCASEIANILVGLSYPVQFEWMRKPRMFLYDNKDWKIIYLMV